MAVDVAVAVFATRFATEDRDVGSRGAVDEQKQRDADPDEQAGEGVEHGHAEQRCERGDEIRARNEPELASEPLRVGVVEHEQRREVDQLDHRRDHDRRQGGFGEVLEQPGQREQSEDRQRGDDQPRELAAGARGSVDGGLRETAIDDHPAGQPGGDVRRAEPEELAVGFDLLVLARGIGLGGPQAFGEPDEHDADPAGHE